MIRPILSLKKLSFDKTEGKVSYQYGKLRGEEERMDYLEFIARATSHIPDKGQVTLRYHGGFAQMRTEARCVRQEQILPIHQSLKMRLYDKIIVHLKLTFMAERPPPPQIVQQELLMAAEERGEYF